MAAVLVVVVLLLLLLLLLLVSVSNSIEVILTAHSSHAQRSFG